MIYTALTKQAMKIAFEAHKNQVDKSGLPYIYHPIHLAEQMEDEVSVCAALLHDTVEDTDITFENLKEYGFPEQIIAALKLLTHNQDIPYMEYIKEIKKNEIARRVKLADLAHNSNLSRLDVVDKNTMERMKKYFRAIIILNDCDKCRDAKYFIMDKRRLVMMNENLFYSVSNAGQWVNSSYDLSRYYDAAYNYEEFEL